MSDDHAEDIPENAEPLVFAKIVRHIAERLNDDDNEAAPEDMAHAGALFMELADAFENTSGFEFTPDQALPLSHAFVTLEGGMRLLAEQAHEGGHANAAAKMEWAAMKARAMAGKLEAHHLEGAGGIVAFGVDEDGDDPIGEPQGTA